MANKQKNTLHITAMPVPAQGKVGRVEYYYRGEYIGSSCVLANGSLDKTANLRLFIQRNKL